MMLDWDHFFFNVWEGDDDPTYEDYQDWLFDTADRALGEG